MTDTYGQRILATGAGNREWEHVFSRYVYETRFADRKSIVDLGPGRCHFVRQAPERIVGVDNAPALVERYRAEGLTMLLGSAYDLPLSAQSVDGLYSCWLLEHLDDPVRCLAEIRRVLRPGGYACLVVPSDRSLRRGFYDDYTHVRPYTRASLDQVARAAGFDDIRTEYLFWTRGLRRLLPVTGEQGVLRALTIADRQLRRLGLVNRYNLVVELRVPPAGHSQRGEDAVHDLRPEERQEDL